jgi:4-amino-4-deoxy-L-arabinose transferase-like glycosyltransferase
MSKQELVTAGQPVGWHGIYQDPLNLPIKLVQSVVFFLAPDHGQLLTRFPNAIFGAITVLLFASLIKGWHGNRTALLATALFAASAWILHSSRLANYDVQYLLAAVMLLRIDHLLPRQHKNFIAIYSLLLVVMLLLYVPGVLWFVILGIYFQRKAIVASWKNMKKLKAKLLVVATIIAGFAPLMIHMLRPGAFKTWLGFPAEFASVSATIKDVATVPINLFVYGPHRPESWLGQAPILDIFALLISLLGIYFYAKHFSAHRTRLLGSFLLVGWLLVGLGGAVSLSVLVPLLYVAAAAGLTYLLKEWLNVFPLNPLARAAGVSLVVLAVSLSCLYNLRAYFVAWPHNSETRAVFIYHR